MTMTAEQERRLKMTKQMQGLRREYIKLMKEAREKMDLSWEANATLFELRKAQIANRAACAALKEIDQILKLDGDGLIR